MPCDSKIDERSERSNLSTNDNAASSKMSNEVYQTGGKLDMPKDSSSRSAHGVLPELSIVDSSAKPGAAGGGDKPGSGQSSGDGKQPADSGVAKNSSTDSASQNSSIDGLNATVNKFEKDITQAVETLGSEIQSFTNKLSQILEPQNSQNLQNVQSPQNSYLNDWMGQPSQGGDWSSRMSAQGFQPSAFDNSNQNFMQQFAASSMTQQNFNFNSSMEGQLSAANDGLTGATQTSFQPSNSFNVANMAALSGTPGDRQSSDSQYTAANTLRSNLSAWAGVTMSALNAFSPMQGGSNNQFSSDIAPVAQTAAMQNYQNNNLSSWFGQASTGDTANFTTGSGQSGDAVTNFASGQAQPGDTIGNVVPASFTGGLNGQFQNFSPLSSAAGTGGAPGDFITPNDFQNNLNKQVGQPQSDGGWVAPNQASPASSASAPSDQVQTTITDGKVSAIGSYNAMDNTLSQYKIGADGNVQSRSVTNMSDGSVDTVTYGANQEAVSHQITKDGQTFDAPIDSTDQVSTTIDSKGNLQSLETRGSNGGSNIYFNSDGQATQQNNITLGNGQASTVVNENLGADGKPTNTTIENRDQSGALRSKIEQDGTETTSRSYDSKQAVVETTIQNPGSEKVITPTADGTKEVTTYDNGSTLTTIKNNDGSSAQATVDNTNNSSEFQVKNADGSTYDWKTNASGQEYRETQPNGYTYDRKTGAGSDEITVTEADGSLHSYKDGVNGTEVTEIKPDQSSYELKIDPNGDQKETVTNGTTGEFVTNATKNGVTTTESGQYGVTTDTTHSTNIAYNPDQPNGTPAVETPAPVVETPAPVVETPAPVVETPAPVVDTPAPAVETPAPAVETPAPVVETPAPAVDTPAPIINDLPVNPIFDTAPTFDTTPTIAPLPQPDITVPQIPAVEPVSPVDTSGGGLGGMDPSYSIEPAMSGDSSFSDGGGGE